MGEYVGRARGNGSQCGRQNASGRAFTNLVYVTIVAEDIRAVRYVHDAQQTSGEGYALACERWR